MKHLKLIMINITLLLCGVLFFLHQEDWIIINFSTSKNFMKKNNVTMQPQETALWIFINGALKKEITEIIFSDNHAQTIKLLINSWLATLDEENIIDKQITVQSVILSPSGQDAFICLTESPLGKQASTHTKLMIMESMLKTLKDANLGLHNIRLLVHHQPIQDAHLNFDISWPINGYIN